jgi:hypothetical protein
MSFDKMIKAIIIKEAIERGEFKNLPRMWSLTRPGSAGIIWNLKLYKSSLSCYTSHR